MIERIGPDVARELGRIGHTGPGASVMPRVLEVWVETVGPTISRNAWPARIGRDGTLHVATDSSSWAFELQQLERDILRRLRAAVGAGAPARLRFTVGKLPELDRDAVAGTRRKPPPPSSEECELAAALVAEIGDSELRALVARAAAHSLARAAADRSF